MALTKETKQNLIKTYARDKNDTGSCEVQIAIISARILELTEHLKANKNDEHSRRGLSKLVSRRKKLLNYLAKRDLEGSRALKAKLGIR